MVIVISLFVGIIAALVLALTMRNFQSQKLKKESAGNFYSAEEVVDEIRTQLERYADQAAQSAYTTWLAQYSYMKNNDERRKLFFDVYEETFRKLITIHFLEEGGDYYYKDWFDGVKTADGARITWNEAEGVIKLGIRPDTDEDGNPLTDPLDPEKPIYISDGEVTVEGISITFTGPDGKSTSITTDLTLNIEYPGFRLFSASNENPAFRYILISDGNIYNSGANDKINLIGNIYSGGDSLLPGTKGIRFSNGAMMQLSSDKIITRETLAADDKAAVTINGYKETSVPLADGGTYFVSDIWANNISLSKSAGGMGGSSITAWGKAYVADDLTLNADNSNFTLTGEYYGYSINNALSTDLDRNGTPDGSSAVIINGKNVNLDLSNAEKIWISGKAFLTVTDNEFESDLKVVNIVQGESLTFRSLQAAYLLPGECMNTYGHNPIDKDEITTPVTVSLSAYRDKTGIDLSSYLDYSQPYKTVTVRYKKGGRLHTLIYYYMNFRNHNAAREYFETYYNANNELSLNRMAMFENGTILVNEDGLINTGNVISYNSVDGRKTLKLNSGNAKYSDEKVVSNESELNTKYEALVTTLNEDNSGTTLDNKLTESIVLFSEVEKDLNGSNMKIITPAGEDYFSVTLPGTTNHGITKHYYLILGKDVNLNDSNYGLDSTGAIVLATGNVNITGGITFNGLIVAGGDICMNGHNMTLKNDDAFISALLSQYPDEVGKYFVETDSFNSGDDTVFSSDLITVDYDNWKKN